MSEQDAGMLAVLVGNAVSLCISLAFFIVIAGAIAYFLTTCLNRIPAQHRKQEPGMVWLMMIPLVNIVWNFFVFPKVAESFQSYFDEQGDTSVGDCGKQLSTFLCISVVLSIVPLLSCLTAPVSLVLLIMVLLKFNELKNRITVV